MTANLENSAVATRLEKVSFHFQPQRKSMPKNVQTTAQLHSSHGRRSLVGCSPWDREESDVTETSLSILTFMHWGRKWQPTPVFLP